MKRDSATRQILFALCTLVCFSSLSEATASEFVGKYVAVAPW